VVFVFHEETAKKIQNIDARRHDTRRQGPSTAMIRTAMMNAGFSPNCPKCGRGQDVPGNLRSADDARPCGEPMHHQQAEDFPAYIVILWLGHMWCRWC